MKRRGMYKPLPSDAPALTSIGEGGTTPLSLSTSPETTACQPFSSPVKNSSSLKALLVRWITSAIHRTSGAGEFFSQSLRELTGPIEFPGSVYGIERCKVCRIDVHRDGEMCFKQMSGDCSACGYRVLLDYYGCPNTYKSAVQGTHRPHNIRPTTPTEWSRRHLKIVKGDP